MVRVSDGRLDYLVAEDVPYVDLTMRVLGIADERGEMEYYTREACVVLEGPGFSTLFGDGCARDDNFFIRADRQDHDNLVSACHSARSQGASVHVDVAWDAGGGAHAADDDNFFKTVVSVEHVGALDGESLLYLAFRDVSEQRTAQHSLARSQFSSALRALFASAGEPDRDALRARLERCKDRVREQSAELGVDPPVTLSIGVVVAVGGNAYNEVFERADRLLYDVKRSGKDALRFE